MSVPAPADKRFRRSRVSPARKRRWQLPWWSIVRVAAIVLVLSFGVYHTVGLVLASEMLTVSRITVQGNQRMSQGEVLALLDGLSNASMVTTDLEAWRQKLLMSPWVEEASIRRMFPGTLVVVISERQPIGVGRIRGRLYLLDGSGSVIDEFGPNYADLDLPVIDGMGDGEADDSPADEERARLAGRLMGDLHRLPALARRVSQIDVSDARNAIVVLKGDTVLVHVGEQRFVQRLQAYLDLVPALREQVPEIDYVDLRFDERVYVKPQGSGSRSVAGLKSRRSGAARRAGG